MKPLNLVVVHLESLSTPMLAHRDQMPCLQAYLTEGVQFSRFMSSSTSSLMAVADFMYGNGSELDHISNFDDVQNRPRGLGPHLFSSLEQANYAVHGVGSPPIWRDDVNGWKLWGDCRNPFRWVENHGQLVNRIEAVTQSSQKPFALYIWDQRSHLSYSGDEKPESMPGFERIRAGRRCLDGTLGAVRKILKDRNLTDNTIVVGFGDHGDQFWTKGSYFGFAHGYEPYTELIWTPAFMCGGGLESRAIDSPVSLVDLSPTLRGLLGLPTVNENVANPGRNVLTNPRRHAFSQNLFSNQEANKALPKAFSVTDKNYHLVASEQGLELFRYEFDWGNHNNILNYCCLNENGRLVQRLGDATHSHLRKTLNVSQMAEIALSFHRLRAVLSELLREKIGAAKKNPFDPNVLLAFRPFGRTWNQDNTITRRKVPQSTIHEFVARTGKFASIFEPLPPEIEA